LWITTGIEMPWPRRMVVVDEMLAGIDTMVVGVTMVDELLLAASSTDERLLEPRLGADSVPALETGT